MDSSQTGSAPGLGRALTKSYNSRPLSSDVSVYEGQGSPSSGGYRDYYYSTVPNPNCARNFIFDQSKLYLSQSPKDRDGSLSQAAHNYTDRQSAAGTSSASVHPSATQGPAYSGRDESQLSDEAENSDDSQPQSHPNKYPVAIEHHGSKQCIYRRQPTRSGSTVKEQHVRIYNPYSSQCESQVQYIKIYQKHLVRICRCGQYSQMEGALSHGRNNDCDGYEIHYSQKCKWKAYDDFKTGARVLIRLCKCYKPT
ncbi:hypothetical protein EB796_005140 [Bugula neritina]|uniref:Uncharacterized protein n=1 Tax=Bugula neritina TaxID=10212 RepID=A0A7J7KD08_BUGNE|nr:hypothetical protein EB796_005140 [Bugula neritina]